MGEGRRENRALAALVSAAALLRLFFVWRYRGFLGGDDLEVVASAARYALGLPDRPFAIRSEFHPLIAAIPVRLGALVGWTGPRAIAFLAALPTIAASTLSIVLVALLGRRLGLSRRSGLAAAFLFAFHPLPLTYGSTPYPRPISTCLLLAAFLLAAPDGASPARLAAAGALAAAAFAVRWSEGAALVPLAAVVAFLSSPSSGERGPADGAIRRLAPLLAGFLAAALLLAGVLDAVTWGRPFASLAAMGRLARDPNLGGFPQRPPFWYATMAAQWIGPILLVLLIVAWRDARSRRPLAIAASFAVVLSFSPLKELRYLQFAIPWLCLAAALGWERLGTGRTPARVLAAALLAASAVLGVERTVHVLSRKSQSAVAAAELVARFEPKPRIVVLEQAWAYGDRLYLGADTQVRDLLPRRPLSFEVVGRTAERADAACLYADDVDAAVEEELARLGLRRSVTIRRGASRPIVVYRREADAWDRR